MMCENKSANLIDLSELEVTATDPSEQSALYATVFNTTCLTPVLTEGRESLDNNPFDQVQKLANCPDDPFESMEKEACFKARCSILPPVEVKTANLLSLSNDNIQEEGMHLKKLGISMTGTVASCGSSIYHSAMSTDLESESPPISMSIKSTSESGSSALDSGAGSASSLDSSSGSFTKGPYKKALEYRKRLLKLSISNSTFNSPVSRRAGMQENDCGFSTICSETSQYGEQDMLASESPLKLVDDDLFGEDSPKEVAMENDFDADLAMLRIPILSELASPVEGKSSPVIASTDEVPPSREGPTENNTPTTKNILPNLAAIRAKLRAKRKEANEQDVMALIENLKSIICETDMVEGAKRQQANSLLETLSTALSSGKDAKTSDEENVQERVEGLQIPQPQPIKRQGTFDIELQESNEDGKSPTTADVVSDVGASKEIVQDNSPAKEIPDIMVQSSATYDGEPIEERENLLLPHVDPISPEITSSTQHNVQPDINEIIEQLGKLLEQQMYSENTEGGSIGCDKNPSSAMNPTFIVVMPTTATTANAVQTSYSHLSPLDDLPIVESSSAMRRRSQSLSLHDKLKIVHVPMPAHPPRTIPLNTDFESPPTPIPHAHGEAKEFKTPCRVIRRNSFSSCTPIPTALNRDGSVNGKRIFGACGTPRRSSILPTHSDREHQRQQQAVVRPFPHANFNPYKPDLKKKTKSDANSSVMKSLGPMKATIPLKKVAPILKTTAAAAQIDGPNDVSATAQRSHLNSSIHLLNKAGRMSYTSTPMPQSRITGSSRFPNACSTPTAPASASATIQTKRRDDVPISKPRYSLAAAATPITKPPPTSLAATSGLKKRTLPELRLKSPSNRGRLSNASSMAAASSSTTGRLGNRSAAVTTAQSNSSRLAHAGSTTRLSARRSMCAPTTVSKNKENRQP